MKKTVAILCIETATTNCSVGVSVNGKLLALEEDNDKNYSHAEKLHLFIDKVVASAGITISEIDAVAVSKGPGSYTGLRIGVSAAKGLCFALNIPLIAINTLESLAAQVPAHEGITIAMLDARRMEVYSAGFNSKAETVFPTRAEVLEETSFLSFLKNEKVVFIGSGAEKFKNLCTHPNAQFLEEKVPSAAQMAAPAYKKFMASDFVDVAYFEPFYLKDFMLD